MTPKAARKLLRKYQHKIHQSDAKWLHKLWKKCVQAALKE